MKLLLCLLCGLLLPSCAYWHFWRGDAEEQKAYQEVTLKYSRQ